LREREHELPEARIVERQDLRPGDRVQGGSAARIGGDQAVLPHHRSRACGGERRGAFAVAHAHPSFGHEVDLVRFVAGLAQSLACVERAPLEHGGEQGQLALFDSGKHFVLFEERHAPFGL
jgi:hypothetical protein